MTTRRQFLGETIGGALGALVGTAGWPSAARGAAGERRANILFVISDDQSYFHTGAAGCRTVQTPAFDAVARAGVLFRHAYCAAPQCSPNRASILTGRNIWQNEEAGTHASNFPRKWPVYPDLLEQAGYAVGCTGKGWGPGNWKISGWPRNPAGPSFDKRKVEGARPQGVSANDYAANFRDFLAARPDGRPFCFWLGATEPHRAYEQGIGVRSGKRLDDVVVPPFLPDAPEIRGDILDYCTEIEWFDRRLARALAFLQESGEDESTLVVVTSDNGMPFPRAKANLYEHGARMPLAIRWPARVKAGRTVDDLVSHIDLAPTFLEAAGLPRPETVTGRSFLNVLTAEASGAIDPARDKLLIGRERHTHARPDNLGYPARAIRTHDFLYIRNLKPDLWPAGDPFGREGYFDIDGGPTKMWMIEHRAEAAVAPLFALGFEKRPAEELYDVRKDPACIENLAGRPELASAQTRLRADLERLLREQKDPRLVGPTDLFDSYPRYSPMRKFPGFREEGAYNPKYQP